MTTRDGGKGDTPRPIKDKEQFDKNWDAIFNKKPEKCINYELEADNDHIEILATIPFGR
jgi:hypothetical protein